MISKGHKIDDQIVKKIISVKMLYQFLNDPNRQGMSEEKQMEMINAIDKIGEDDQ